VEAGDCDRPAEIGRDMMKCKGYIGNVEYDSDSKLFHGEIINTRDVEWCKEEGMKPEK
jgi:predicted HicB family RNase H-like nuclease